MVDQRSRSSPILLQRELTEFPLPCPRAVAAAKPSVDVADLTGFNLAVDLTADEYFISLSYVEIQD